MWAVYAISTSLVGLNLRSVSKYATLGLDSCEHACCMSISLHECLIRIRAAARLAQQCWQMCTESLTSLCKAPQSWYTR